MSHTATFVFGGSAVILGGFIAWFWKREPEKRPRLVLLGAAYVAAIVAAFVIPKEWIPSSAPGRPSWLDIAILAMLVGTFVLAFWKEPSRRRRYALIMGPLIVLLILVNIVYPLVWQR